MEKQRKGERETEKNRDRERYKYIMTEIEKRESMKDKVRITERRERKTGSNRQIDR